MADKNIKGLFITFEGIEGSGKSTHIEFLSRYFKKQKLSVCLLREPGSTKIGERIRQLLLHHKGSILPETELFLYLAARIQLIGEKINKALSKYDAVICDRFSDSTLVYQGYALKLGIEKIQPLVKFVSGNLQPDITFVLDLPAQQGLNRIKRKKDRIEKRPLKFHQDLRKGYRILARKNPGRIKIIQACDKQYVQQEIVKYVTKLVNK